MRDYIPLPRFPIVPSKRGLQKVEDSDFVVRIHKYTPDGNEEGRPEDVFLDWGSTVSLSAPDCEYWVIEIVQVVEREAPLEGEEDGKGRG